VRTANSFSFRYGRVEIRARLPRGDWLWPALWLLPRYNSYGDWPCSGEIDLVETRGNVNYPPGGTDSVGSTLHMAPYWELDDWPHNHGTVKLPPDRPDFSQDFHVFGMVWTEQGIYTYVDADANRVVDVRFDTPFWVKGGWSTTTMDNPWKGRGNAAPFDQEYYLIMNVAVGGTGKYFPDGVGNKPWVNSDPHAPNSFWAARQQWLPTWQGEGAALQVDWVRVWQ